VNSHYNLELTECLYARMRCHKTGSSETQVAVIVRLRARSLHEECEKISCFQIDLRDPASPILARFGTGRLYSPPKVKLALRAQRFSEVSETQRGVTELLTGVPFEDFERALRSQRFAKLVTIILKACNKNFYIYTGCPGRNVKNFGRVFLMLKYTDITQNTYIQS
jgi:hypothetical protein